MLPVPLSLTLWQVGMVLHFFITFYVRCYTTKWCVFQTRHRDSDVPFKDVRRHLMKCCWSEPCYGLNITSTIEELNQTQSSNMDGNVTSHFILRKTEFVYSKQAKHEALPIDGNFTLNKELKITGRAKARWERMGFTIKDKRGVNIMTFFAVNDTHEVRIFDLKWSKRNGDMAWGNMLPENTDADLFPFVAEKEFKLNIKAQENAFDIYFDGTWYTRFETKVPTADCDKFTFGGAFQLLHVVLVSWTDIPN